MTGEFDGLPVVDAGTAGEWREWLGANASSSAGVWLILHNRSSPAPGVGFAEAVEQALCFGWIDSKAIKRDRHSRYQKFTPRNPKSTWSAVNRERAARMIADGAMTAAGQALVDHARATGRWDVMAAPENATVAEELAAALAADPVAAANFEAFPPSARRLTLEWIAAARRPDTRARRVARAVERAAGNERVTGGPARPDPRPPRGGPR